MVMDWDDEEAYHRTEESFQRYFTTLRKRTPFMALSMERCPIHGTNVTAGIMKRVSRKKIPGIQGKHIVKPMEMFLGMRCCLPEPIVIFHMIMKSRIHQP